LIPGACGGIKEVSPISVLDNSLLLEANNLIVFVVRAVYSDLRAGACQLQACAIVVFSTNAHVLKYRRCTRGNIRVALTVARHLNICGFAGCAAAGRCSACTAVVHANPRCASAACKARPVLASPVTAVLALSTGGDAISVNAVGASVAGRIAVARL